MIMLRRPLFEVQERASLFEHRALEAAIKAMDAFRKGQDSCQELLDSYQNTYTMGAQWCKRKVAKHYPKLDLDMLCLGRSSFGSNSGSYSVDEGGEATSPTF